jgi:transcriptional regulator with XRE-family HTH domain
MAAAEHLRYVSLVKCSTIGDRLREARERLGWTRRRVSLEAGLAPETAYSIESSTRMPGIDTTERLASVMNVSAAWLAYGSDSPRQVRNFIPAPGFFGSSRAMMLEAQLRGAGGPIDQSYLYADPIGAARYMEIAQTYRGLPVKEAAAAVRNAVTDSERMTLIALGSGHARQESVFAESFLRSASSPGKLAVFLVDSSICMLTEGYRYASEYLSHFDAPIVAVEGDFSNLPAISDSFGSGVPTRRIFTLLGYTIANLPNELSLLRDSLASTSSRGDFLLLDFCTAPSTKSVSAKSIVAADPVARLLEAGATPRTNKLLAFLAGPVTRQYGEVTKLELRGSTDAGSIPKSTACEFWCSVDTDEGTKRFMTASWRRYAPNELVKAFARVGWQLVEKWEWSPERPSLLALFQRT